jgi:formylglycine-generating enzyme required for sulfatase activity
VTIGQPFAVGKFEVTFAQWDACVAAGGCAPPEEGLYSPADRGWGRDSRPVINVSWQDAKRYVRWLNGRIGGKAYRLLSESEWEYAARAGTTTRWSFGDVESQLEAYAWFRGNSGGKTQPVGGKAGNPWGLFDMHGNVWEWVEDCYNDNLANTPTNGAANTTGGCDRRGVRGGSIYGNPPELRSANRDRDMPGIRGISIGFRLSRTL